LRTVGKDRDCFICILQTEATQYGSKIKKKQLRYKRLGLFVKSVVIVVVVIIAIVVVDWVDSVQSSQAHGLTDVRRV